MNINKNYYYHSIESPHLIKNSLRDLCVWAYLILRSLALDLYYYLG